MDFNVPSTTAGHLRSKEVREVDECEYGAFIMRQVMAGHETESEVAYPLLIPYIYGT